MKRALMTVTAIILLVCITLSFASCGDKKENGESKGGKSTEATADKYVNKADASKETSTLDNVYTALKVALEDENTYQIDTVDNNNGQVKWVKLADLRNATTGEYAPLAAELFGTNGDIGTLDIGYTYAGGDNGSPFKSDAAKGAYVYFAISGNGRLAVCLSGDGANVITAFGENGIVGDIAGDILF